MSRLSKTNNLLETLPAESRSAIAGLIDVKVDSDMDRVLSEIKTLKVEMNSRIDSMESKFDAKIDAMDAKIDSIEKTFTSQIGSLKWFIGILVTMIVTKLFL